MRAEDLLAAVRTVTHAANYFEELKLTVRELAARLAMDERGYFTPVEEERTHGLLVSYCQARNALLELITSFRLDGDLSDEDRPAAFLTAFAAALILVDAARFLRETVHDRPVIRSKLNEPAPQFAVAAGVYDTVQKSLVSSQHAWHLYHAIRYFDENQPQLRSLANRSDLAGVVQIIDRLRHRLDVSVVQFARTRLRLRASQAVNMLVRDTLGRALYGLHKLSGTMLSDKYVRRGHRPQLPDEIAARLRSLLVPGDVLIVRKEYALTNYFLPGYWPHAALYLGGAADLERLGIRDHQWVRPRWKQLLEASTGEPCRVLESMKDGVLIRPLTSPLGSDSIVVLRPQLSPPELSQALSRVMAHEGKCYDFDFDFTRSDRLVCTEVVYRAYEGVGSMTFPLTRRFGRLTLSGGDLMDMALERKRLNPIAVFAPSLASGLITGETVDSILRAGQRRGDLPT